MIKVGDWVKIIKTPATLGYMKGQIRQVDRVDREDDDAPYGFKELNAGYLGCFWFNKDKLKELPYVDTPLWKVLNDE